MQIIHHDNFTSIVSDSFKFYDCWETINSKPIKKQYI